MIGLAKGAQREIEDKALTRYALAAQLEYAYKKRNPIVWMALRDYRE